MYLTAASAAWRYSGKVTGPDSRFSSPTVIGVPVAAFGAPSAADVSCAGVLVAFAALVSSDFDDESPPQAARSVAAAASVANAAVRCLVFTGRLLLWMVMRGPRRRRRGSWSAGGRAGRAARPPRPQARAGRG